MELEEYRQNEIEPQDCPWCKEPVRVVAEEIELPDNADKKEFDFLKDNFEMVSAYMTSVICYGCQFSGLLSIENEEDLSIKEAIQSWNRIRVVGDESVVSDEKFKDYMEYTIQDWDRDDLEKALLDAYFNHDFSVLEAEKTIYTMELGHIEISADGEIVHFGLEEE